MATGACDAGAVVVPVLVPALVPVEEASKPFRLGQERGLNLSGDVLRFGYYPPAAAGASYAFGFGSERFELASREGRVAPGPIQIDSWAWAKESLGGGRAITALHEVVVNGSQGC